MPPSRAVVRLARRILRTAPGEQLGRHTYRGAIALASRAAAALPGVAAVYTTGSSARPASLAPGYSDIDLFLLVRTRDAGEELRLRAGIRRLQRGLHGVVPLFSHLDYLELSDLPLVRRWGNAWALDMDRRFTHEAGAQVLGEAVAVPAWERDLEQLVACLRRWAKAAADVLSPHPPDPLDLDGWQRGARRLLSDVLAGWLDLDRQQPLQILLQRAALRAGPDLRALHGLARAAQRPADGRELSAAALEVLEAWCAELCADFQEPGKVTPVTPVTPVTLVSRGAGPGVAGGGPLRAAGQAAVTRFGFQAALALPGTPGSRPRQLALLHPGGDGPGGDGAGGDGAGGPERVTAAMAAWLTAAAPEAGVGHPVLLTPALWRACALLEPAPFAAAAADQPGALLAGIAPAPPPWPAQGALDRLLIGRLAQSLWRLNGRGLRSGRGADTALASADQELELCERRLAALGGQALSVAPFSPPRTRDEAALVAALRRHRMQVRQALSALPT